MKGLGNDSRVQRDMAAQFHSSARIEFCNTIPHKRTLTGVSSTSAMGHSRPKSTIQVTSAYPLRAEVQRTSLMVRFVPIAEVAVLLDDLVNGGEQTGPHGECQAFWRSEGS